MGSLDLTAEERERLRSGPVGRQPNDAYDYRCEECRRAITVGPSGTEYGHERGRGSTGTEPRCSRRPTSVDPKRADAQSDGGGWVGDEANRQRGVEARHDGGGRRA